MGSSPTRGQSDLAKQRKKDKAKRKQKRKNRKKR
jgi:hypothetical protein